MRLTSFSESFSGLTKPALFQSLLLDGYGARAVGQSWYSKDQHGAEKLWHEYLVQRVLTEKDPAVGRYVEVREIAQRICKEMGTSSDFRATVQSLCWVCLERATQCPGRRGTRWTAHSGETFETSIAEMGNLGVSLLSAAAHFNLLHLIETLLADGHCPAKHNCLLPPAMEVAARNGNIDVLDRLQRHMPELQTEGPYEWYGKIGPCSLDGAAIRGDLDVLKFALYPPSRADPDSTDLLGQPFGGVENDSPIGRELCGALWSTTSPEVFAYLRDIPKDPITLDDLYERLVINSQRGNLDMVRYFLDTGVPVQTKHWRMHDAPLVQACKGCHEGVVDLLLERGADPNYGADRQQGLRPRIALPMAAKSGSLAIVRKLLDHGAHVNEVHDHPGNVPAIWYAFYLEHTAMIKLLLERGASLRGGVGTWFDGWIGPTALDMAVELGLDSMADILRANGATVDPVRARGESSQWKRFQLWAYDDRY